MLTDELDFKWINHGPFCTLDPLSVRAKTFLTAERLEGVAFEHDDLFRVEILLNQNDFTIKVD